MMEMPPYAHKPQGGRPTVFTKEIQDIIVEELLNGNYFETACAMAGINKSTGYAWLKEGRRNPESELRQFSDAVRQAQAQSEAEDVRDLKAMGKQDWKVIAWRLERKYPKRWGKIEKLEHTGKDGGPVSFTEWVQKVSGNESKEPQDDEEDEEY